MPTYSTQAAFFDYDNDGDLDAYLLNHNVRDFKRFDVKRFTPCAIPWLATGFYEMIRAKFVDVRQQVGIKGNPIGFDLGIHTADLNNDG